MMVAEWKEKAKLRVKRARQTQIYIISMPHPTSGALVAAPWIRLCPYLTAAGDL